MVARLEEDVNEFQWFEMWAWRVQQTLSEFADPYLHPQEKSLFLEDQADRIVRADIIGWAQECCLSEWGNDNEGACTLLKDEEMSIQEVLRQLFGRDVPLAVCIAALKVVAIDEPLGEAIRTREKDCEEVGVPGFVWVASLEGDGAVNVSVRSRAELQIRDLRLVEIKS